MARTPGSISERKWLRCFDSIMKGLQPGEQGK